MRNYHTIYFGLFFMLGFLLGCTDEEQKNYYATFDEAIQDSAVQRGLIPPNLPPSSKDIHEQHFIDLDFVWVQFIANAEDFTALTNNLSLLTSKEIRILGRKIIAPPESWPKILNKKSLSRMTDNFPFVVARYDYTVEYGNNKTIYRHGYFFLNPTTGEGYYAGGTRLKVGQ